MAAHDPQTLYSIVDIDAVGCSPTGLNDLGVVIGACSPGGSLDSTAFRWHDGVATSLGKLRKANYSLAHAGPSTSTTRA